MPEWWVSRTGHARFATYPPRTLIKGLLSKLNDLSFIRDKLNVLITGPTGVGKSYLACALGQISTATQAG